MHNSKIEHVGATSLIYLHVRKTVAGRSPTISPQNDRRVFAEITEMEPINFARKTGRYSLNE
jgi:hypothetical protein